MRTLVILLALTACKGPDITVAPIDFEDFEGLPTANAGADQEVDETDTVVLIGQADDTDGDIVATSWRMLTGPEDIELSVTGETATFEAPATKDRVTYTFRFEAEDNDGFELFDDVDVVVLPVNEDPVVDAGEAFDANERTDVVITGDASDDDGFIVSWDWQQTAGPDVTIANIGAPATSFRAPDVDEPTELTFSLTVADDEGGTATDQLVVTILDANDPPLVNANDDQTVNENTEVQLLGDAVDVDGGIASTLWTQINGPSVILTQTGSASATFIAPPVDVETTLTLRLTATDTDGASSFDDTVILVLPFDQGPSTYAGDDFTAFEQTEVDLNGGADDVDGVIETYLWTQLGGVSATLVTPDSPSTVLVLPDVLDETLLTFRLTATDDAGNEGSDEVTVTVRPRNQEPIVDAGPTQNVRIASQVNLLGSGTDPDGSIVSWQWEQTAGPSVTLSNADGPTSGFTAPLIANDATLSFSLTGIDNEGASGTDTVDVHVRAQLFPPVADAGDDKFVDSDQLVVIEGMASDQDGTIVSYLWEQIDGPPVELLATNAATTGLQAPPTACGEVVRLRLTVTDNDGLTDTDDIGVVISGVNRPVVQTNTILDFEEDTDGVQVDGGVWELGLPISGPFRAFSGIRAWATNLSGNYSSNETGVLCLPVVDLSTAAEPSFVMAAWVRTGSGDALGVEVLDPDNGWSPLVETLPRREGFDADGQPGWQRLGYRDDYDIIVASLAEYAGQRALLRVTFRANANSTSLGAYVDTMGFYDESDDPDNDGLPGILNEVVVHNTNPFLPDTDGDGFTDGAEVIAGSSGDNPAWTPDTIPWPLDHEESLQLDNGGLATIGELWEYGTPTSGASGGHTGSFAWGTDLDSTYFSDAEEYLYLPPVQLTDGINPTLSFRMHNRSEDGDTTRVEVRRPNGEWEPVLAAFPQYHDIGVDGFPGWRDHFYLDQYELAAVSLADHVGRQVELRIAFTSDDRLTEEGVYIDDIGVHEESSDPDNDGLLGVIGEFEQLQTDPFVADTDNDGTSDSVELSDLTDALNPAWFASADPLQPGERLDFDNGSGGVATLPWHQLWQLGPIRSGPGEAFSGTRGWATNLEGNYFSFAHEHLFLPPLDLTSATQPILTARFSSRGESGDGFRLEIDAGSGWLDVEPAFPEYDSTVAGGHPAWTDQGYLNDYVLMAFNLSPWAGQQVRTRFTFVSDDRLVDSGVYLDNIGLWEEGSDPDNDGIVGVLAEVAAQSTDPLVSDTDGDGVNDGPEVAGNHDPLNPATFPGVQPMTPGTLLTFEESRQGVATLGDLWEYGPPNTDAIRAYSGTVVWATNLVSAYYSNAREYLYLPPLDLAAGDEPVLALRIQSRIGDVDDGFFIETRTSVDEAWSPVVPDSPMYDGNITGGWQAWRSHGYRSNYDLFLIPLSSVDVNQLLATRLAFWSDDRTTANGVFLDDVLYSDENDDYDGDGLVGMMNELGTYGTDPTLFDTDGDGSGDGAEIAANTDPLNPAWFPGGPVLSLGTLLDFESDDGGLVAGNDQLFNWGVVTEGPETGNSGTNAWGTNLGNNYFSLAREYLYLPPIELSGASAPYLTFALHMAGESGDALSIEIERGADWFPIPPATPGFDGQDDIGQAGWEFVGGSDSYVTVGVDLAEYAGAPLRLRFAFRSDDRTTNEGATIDDIRIFESP